MPSRNKQVPSRFNRVQPGRHLTFFPNITGSDALHSVACFFQVLKETLRGTPVD